MDAWGLGAYYYTSPHHPKSATPDPASDGRELSWAELSYRVKPGFYWTSYLILDLN